MANIEHIGLVIETDPALIARYGGGRLIFNAGKPLYIQWNGGVEIWWGGYRDYGRNAENPLPWLAYNRVEGHSINQFGIVMRESSVSMVMPGWYDDPEIIWDEFNR